MIFQRIIAFFTALFSTISALFGISVPLGDKTGDFRVTTYIVAENILSPSALHEEDFDIITNVILFGCATFNEKGEISINEPVLTKAMENLRNVTEGRDITITLNLLGPQNTGGYSDYYEGMEYQAALHGKAFSSGVLEDNILSVLDSFSFDGVHFDYEYPITRSAWKDFNSFLIRFDKKIGDKKIGVAVSCWDMGLSTKAMDATDYIELMLYDNYDSENRHSPYKTCVSQVKELSLKGLPLYKINFGLPFYARPTDRGAYWYGYNGYYDRLDENGYFYDENICKAFWFNTPSVIAEKTAFARENGFGGVMIWHYTCDLPSSDENSLLRAIKNTIEKE